MNTIIVFFPLQYQITLAVDCCTALTFRFLAASWWKIHSHLFEFLSAVFTRFHVRLHIPWVWQCLNSQRLVPYLHIGETWSFLLPSTWLIESLLHKEKKLRLIFSAKKLIWQEICSSNSVFIIRSQKIYSRASVWVVAQHLIVKGSLTNKKEDFKRWDRRPSFSIS